MFFSEIQGVSHWNVRFEMVLRGRRINNFADFSLNACSAAMGIWVSSINFYINDTGCPPQPQVWRLPKLNLEFHDSTQKINVFKTLQISTCIKLTLDTNKQDTAWVWGFGTICYWGSFGNAWIWDFKVIYYHGCLWAFMGVPGRILVAPLLFGGEKNKVVERINKLCWDKTNWDNGNSKILKENWRNIIIKSAE